MLNIIVQLTIIILSIFTMIVLLKWSKRNGLRWTWSMPVMFWLLIKAIGGILNYFFDSWPISYFEKQMAVSWDYGVHIFGSIVTLVISIMLCILNGEVDKYGPRT